MTFPTSLDSFVTKYDLIDDVLAADVNSLQTAVAALEAKVGVNSSTVTSSLDYKVAAVAVVATSGSGLGVGQTWQNFTGSRAVGVSYTNSTGKPIVVMMSVSGAYDDYHLTVDGLTMTYTGGTGYNSSTIIHTGSTYNLSINSASYLLRWYELR